jgi:hypothetical protein
MFPKMIPTILPYIFEFDRKPICGDVPSHSWLVVQNWSPDVAVIIVWLLQTQIAKNRKINPNIPNP